MFKKIGVFRLSLVQTLLLNSLSVQISSIDNNLFITQKFKLYGWGK